MKTIVGFLFFTALAVAAVPSIEDFNAAIRADDLATLHQLVQSRNDANVTNGLQATPLHYAAIHGSAASLRFLLENGADPNTPNLSGATPLMLAAWSYERVRLLVEHGANVNASNKAGITPLLVSASAHGNIATVRYLLEKGADVKAQTAYGEDALMRASLSGDCDMVKLLLERGAVAKHSDKFGNTALANATTFSDAGRIKMLLAAGSDPNSLITFAGMVRNGPIALTHFSPLMSAAPFSDQETITALLKAGARVNEKDVRDMTPLMLSIATDHAQPATVRQLIAAGADIQAKDKYGDSVLDWARKFNNPDIIDMLMDAGAKGRAVTPAPVSPLRSDMLTPNDAISRSLKLLGQSTFFAAGGGCSGCHHQPAHARAYIAAKNANISSPVDLGKSFHESTIAIRPRLLSVLPYLSTFGGDEDGVLSFLSASIDLREPPSEFLDSLVHFLAVRQDPSGAWINFGVARPPLAESSISRTAQAIAILSQYSWPARQAEFQDRIHKAGKWLRQAMAETTYEQADRILGLHEAGVSNSDLGTDAECLLKLQRQDGGWAQTKYLPTDAYATGLVLESLFRAGLLKTTDVAYQRGVAFLLRTQFPDGSWYVRSRAPKFQPYFQSDLPFAHDQWISSFGTSWAVIALSHVVTSAVVARAY